MLKDCTCLVSAEGYRRIIELTFVGNALNVGFIEEPCYNLVYLELAACRLKVLPPNLGALVPNVRVLNLNYNFIEDAKPLKGLTRLKKLTVIGSRLRGTKPLVRVLRRMPDVEMLDFRYVFFFQWATLLAVILRFWQNEPMHIGMVFTTAGERCAWGNARSQGDGFQISTGFAGCRVSWASSLSGADYAGMP